jgi:hypothetical protein
LQRMHWAKTRRGLAWNGPRRVPWRFLLSHYWIASASLSIPEFCFIHFSIVCATFLEGVIFHLCVHVYLFTVCLCIKLWAIWRQGPIACMVHTYLLPNALGTVRGWNICFGRMRIL